MSRARRCTVCDKPLPRGWQTYVHPACIDRIPAILDLHDLGDAATRGTVTPAELAAYTAADAAGEHVGVTGGRMTRGGR